MRTFVGAMAFQSSRPVAGARILSGDDDRPPHERFQSSRPVAGARIQADWATRSMRDFVSILAPRCRGAHRCPMARKTIKPMFQSSRPVAGARIDHHAGRPAWPAGFNPRAPLPGRASLIVEMGFKLLAVSILAPRCRGAHPPNCVPAATPTICFNPRAPLPGRASRARRGVADVEKVSILAPRCRGAHQKRLAEGQLVSVGFNPRAPLPGRASAKLARPFGPVRVSILAPRCRGAHRLLSCSCSSRKMFQSSRPVAGARIFVGLSSRVGIGCFNPRAPLPGRASKKERLQPPKRKVSILAPRCRGAHRPIRNH